MEQVDEYDDAIEAEQRATAAEVDESWRRRASDVIPGGTSTGSKRPEALYGDANETGPTHYVRASGCHVYTAADERLIDCTMALGAVALGYADEGVVRAVLVAAADGNVAGLASTVEVEVAEQLCEIIPCAEQVRFLKSGAEAVSAAVRIARAATGRDRVVASGYFGWHDWANPGPGVPPGATSEVARVAFDDALELERACRDAGHDLAAVVIEPVVERLPSTGWIERARWLCDELGAALVFDEMKTGFRLKPGGYQELSGVKPDLAVFGKAMANGFPVAAVVGSAGIMDAARGTWISSTLAGEGMSLAAVRAVLERYEKEDDICGTLGAIGAEMRASLEAAVRASGIEGVSVEGLDAMWLLRFADPAVERRFLEIAVANGVLFKRGPYNYPSLAHGEDDTVVEIERAASSTFVELVEELRQ